MARRSLGGCHPLSRREAFLAVFHVPIGSSPGHLHGGPASRPAAAPAPVRRSGHGGRRPPRPAGEHRPLHTDRADTAAAADRGAGSRVPGSGVHGDAGPDPPPSPLGGRRGDHATEPRRAVPSSPPPPPRRRSADRRRPGAARRPGLRRSLRSSARGRAFRGSRARAGGQGERHLAPPDGRAAADEVGRLRPSAGYARAGAGSGACAGAAGVTGGERVPYARPGEPGGRRYRRQPRPRSGGGPAAGAAG